jgi:hypothetical protein
MDRFFKKIDIQHYNNDVILNEPYVQSLLVKKDYERPWNLRLFDLKSVLPDFYNWVEEYFKSPITVTRFFISLPNSSTVIHEDAGYNTCLNIPIINCDKYSKNVWYNCQRDQRSTDEGWIRDSDSVPYAANDGGAWTFPHEAVIEPIYEMVLDSPVIFNTSIAHNVVTEEFEIKEYPRIVLTVRTKTMTRNSGISFDDFIKNEVPK